MDASSAVNASILLVDGNPASASMASVMLKSKYEVMTAVSGRDALRILLTKQYGFNLVLADVNLPDMNSFAFVREVVEKTQLPVGMICDSYDQPTITRCRLSGAMLCLVKPLRSVDIEDLWQYPALRQMEVMVKSHRFPMTGSPENGPILSPVLRESVGGFQGLGKRKSIELGGANGWSVGKSSLFPTPVVKRRFPHVTQGAGPSGVTRHLNPPGITSNLVVRNLQQNRVYGTNQRAFLPQMGYSGVAQNPLSITGQPMGQGTNNRNGTKYRDAGESSLARYLGNPFSREQLKRIINGSLRKWDVFPNLTAPWVAPPPLAPVIPNASAVPPISIPLALAREIEEFIHITKAVLFAAPGSLIALASRVGAIGPPLGVTLQLADGELEPGVLEDLDTDDIFDAIDELRD
ncbi:hypothetical protein vseg_009302 [Gypsophila vaccaria]